MTTITLDRIKQLVPGEYVTYLNEECFEPVLKQDKVTGEILDTDGGIVPKCLLNEVLGLNAVNLTPKGILLDYTGKIVADKGYLGLLDANNIELAFQKIQDSSFVKFTSIDDLLSSQVLYVDVTTDIEVEDKAKTLYAISYYSELNRKCNVKKYNTSGLLFPHISKSHKDSLVIYDKQKQLATLNRNGDSAYIQTIGLDTLEKKKNVLRVERHIGKFADMRSAFELNQKVITLNDVLYTDKNPVASKFEEVVGMKNAEVF